MFYHSNRRQTKTLVQIIIFENFIYECYIYIISPPFFLQILLSPPHTPFQIQGLFFLIFAAHAHTHKCRLLSTIRVAFAYMFLG